MGQITTQLQGRQRYAARVCELVKEGKVEDDSITEIINLHKVGHFWMILVCLRGFQRILRIFCRNFKKI